MLRTATNFSARTFASGFEGRELKATTPPASGGLMPMTIIVSMTAATIDREAGYLISKRIELKSSVQPTGNREVRGLVHSPWQACYNTDNKTDYRPYNRAHLIIRYCIHHDDERRYVRRLDENKDKDRTSPKDDLQPSSADNSSNIGHVGDRWVCNLELADHVSVVRRESSEEHNDENAAIEASVESNIPSSRFLARNSRNQTQRRDCFRERKYT